jgi:uncharacterized protein (DUF2235 family)
MKRIVICADGTWNVRDQVSKNAKTRHPTNVTKVARAILPRASTNVDQIVYYHEGVGTGVGRDRVTGGAFGSGIETNIRALYRFILYNYLEGDELFFFGFSRGAFTVRTLAGFMNRVGLLHKDDDYFIPEIYACYENNQKPGTPEWDKVFGKLRDPRPCPPIKFIGVWDTVGALGAPGFLGQFFNKKKYQYHDVGLNRYIQNAFHALAIDERRKPFTPNIWERVAGFNGNLEQAWFAGVHSNVGGSCVHDGLANEALHWIVEKAETLGLEVDKPFLAHFKPCFNSDLEDSMSTMYKMLGPYVRPIGQHSADGESIHQSAIDRIDFPSVAYAPPNLKSYLSTAPNPRKSKTTRIPTGTPCKAAPT